MTQPLHDELAEDSRVRSIGTKSLEEQVIEVARLRRELESWGRVLEEKERAYLEATKRHRELATGTKAELSAAEHVLRALTIQKYEETGEKKPAFGVSVRSEVTLDYKEGDAIEWAKNNPDAGALLKLAKGPFEKVAAAIDLPFVKKDTEPKATIAKDLSEVLR